LLFESTGIKRVGEIGVPNIDRYLAELDRRGVAGTTRKRKVVSIRSFFTFLYQDNHIAVNLAKRIIPPYASQNNPRFLTEAE
jgi:site-specific recombinase XerD